MFKSEERIDPIISPEEAKKMETDRRVKVDLPDLKPNRMACKNPKYYIYFEAYNEKELEDYYKFLREFEEATNDRDRTVMQVQVRSTKNVRWLPSMLGNCFRLDEPFNWYRKTSIRNSHWLIKLKNIPSIDDIDDLVELINDTKLIYEDDNILIVYYNFSINS